MFITHKLINIYLSSSTAKYLLVLTGFKCEYLLIFSVICISLLVEYLWTDV